MIPRAAILPPRATMDDLAAGSPVPALETPLLDAACLSDADELRRVVPVDERTRYAAMRERAEKAEAERDAARARAAADAAAWPQLDAARIETLEALRLLAEVWASRPISSMPWLRESVEAALAGARATAPTAADFAAMAGLPDPNACPHCGMGADLCPLSCREVCAIVNSLPTHAETMALPGHEAAERSEHPSEPTAQGTYANATCEECASADGWHALGCPKLAGLLGLSVATVAGEGGS